MIFYFSADLKKRILLIDILIERTKKRRTAKVKKTEKSEN